METLVLAHYYAPQEVKQLANFVGDSLELAIKARDTKADRIVFAGVRFMAETAKLLNPDKQVILVAPKATCSLVTQAKNILYDITLLRQMCDIPFKVVTYINSSIELKAISDIIVTSANVEEIINGEILKGNRVYFTPDRNMGAYLKQTNQEWGDMFDYYKEAVCIVHDKFKEEEISYLMREWSDYPKVLLAHPESPLPVLNKADFVGSTSKMLKWVNAYIGEGSIYIATEVGLIYDMQKLRPDLDIQQAPTYTGCQCNECPYMKMNQAHNVKAAIDGFSGEEIQIPEKYKESALRAIKGMLN